MLFDLFQLFFPNYCSNCKINLRRIEKILCTECLKKIPIRPYIKDVNLLNSLKCIINIEQAFSLLYFKNQIITSNLIYALKYNNKQRVGIELGNYMGSKLPTVFDCIIPIPLHKNKLKKRGFNQSEKIAIGIGQCIDIPIIVNNLVRIVNNPSQAHLTSSSERVLNTFNIFEIKDENQLENKHILLVDDIITTGSTIYSAIDIILNLKNTKVSVACLSFAG